MTRQASFKQKVRARMEKTGERYAAARQALLRQPRGGSSRTSWTTVPDYEFARGLEPDHALLASALAQAGVVDPASGEPFSETRLFGLSGGIGFMSFLFEYQGHPPLLTFVCRSFSMPEPVVARALAHAGIAHQRSETGSATVARKFVDEALSRSAAVHATIDYASLPSAGMPAMWAGGMPRQANIVGRDGDAYVLDLGAPARLDAATLARIRGAAKKEKHRAITFEPGVADADPVAATRAALRFTAGNLIEAPYKNFAGNFGLAALEKQARLCRDAKDKRGWPRVFDSGPLACLALYRTWEGLMLELTAPAGGRLLYAEFLEGSARLPGLGPLAEAADLARRSGELFSRLTDQLPETAPEVAEAITLSEEIDELQRTGGEGNQRDVDDGADDGVDDGADDRVGQQVKALRAARTAAAERCMLGSAARAAAFAQVGETFAAIHGVETELQKVLAAV